MVIVMAKLTAKQQRFCDEYLIDLNATQAAIRAGYSKKTAYKASDWLNEKSQEKPSSKFNRAMREYIDNRLAEKEKALIADQDEVLKYLTSVLRGQSKSTEIVIEGLGDGSTKARKMEKEPSEKDKLKAAELLGKRYGLYTEKVEEKVDMELNVTIDYGDEEDTGGDAD
jgi:phage terminase small subunit